MRTNDTGSVSFSRTSTRTSCSRGSAANIAPVGPHPAMITSNMRGARSAPEAGDRSPGTSPTVKSRSTGSFDHGSAVNCGESIGVAFRECLVVEALPATPRSIAGRHEKGEHPHRYSVHGSHLLGRCHGPLQPTSISITLSNPRLPSQVVTTPNGPVRLQADPAWRPDVHRSGDLGFNRRIARRYDGADGRRGRQ